MASNLSRASGMDLRSNEVVKIKPGETQLVCTGLYVEIPSMLEFQMRPRSGLSLKTSGGKSIPSLSADAWTSGFTLDS